MSRITTCPHCSARLRVSEQITDKILTCPRCLADVDNARPGSQIRAADLNTDVKRDVKVGCIVIAVLIALGVLGIVMGGAFIPLLFFGAIAVLVIIAIIRSLTRGDASGAPVSTAERVFNIVFLVVGTIVAIVIFVWIGCAIAISNMQFGR